VKREITKRERVALLADMRRRHKFVSKPAIDHAGEHVCYMVDGNLVAQPLTVSRDKRGAIVSYSVGEAKVYAPDEGGREQGPTHIKALKRMRRS
jgi:hypothetical protein